MEDLYYLDPVPSSDGIEDTTKPTTLNGTSGSASQPYAEDPKLVRRVESLEKYVQDLRAKALRLDEDGRLNNLEVKNRLTAFFGKIGGWIIDNGKLSTANIDIDSNNQWIRSKNYNPGVDGFTIQSDMVEAQNLRARGSIQGTTFSYDKVSAVGGQMIIANSDVLDEPMGEADNATLTVKGDTTFSVNDILLMRGVATTGVQEEWFRVTDATNAPTYTVTRDLASSFGANANPAWKKGTPVVKQGVSNGTDTYSGGWLKLIGQGVNSPYYAVYARTGVDYDSYAERLRIGNLNGVGGKSSDCYGAYIGNSTTGNYLIYDDVSGKLIVNDSNISNSDIFGDGNDGDVTISSNTTLTSDMYYNNLTVNSGVTLNTGGYRIFVKGILTNEGTISRDGNDGSNGDDAVDGASGFGAGGAGATGLATGTIYGSLDGSDGADGKSTNSGYLAGGAGVAGTAQTESFASDGADGGAGGTFNGSYPGGAGGAGGTATETVQPIRNSTFAIIMREFSAEDTIKYIKSSAGSGGGGSGSVYNPSNYTATGGGGGAGSGGGIILIVARKLINSGTISSNGGVGGDAGGNYADGGIFSGSGGGAGGSGGLIFIIYGILTDTGTIEASGGAGGSGHAGDTGDGGYTTAWDGADGDTGEAGRVIYMEK